MEVNELVNHHEAATHTNDHVALFELDEYALGAEAVDSRTFTFERHVKRLVARVEVGRGLGLRGRLWLERSGLGSFGPAGSE